MSGPLARSRLRSRWAAVLAVGLAVAWAAREGPRERGPAFASCDPTGRGAVQTLFEAGRSGEMVDAIGAVRKVLPDDLDGSRHQRFLLDLGGHTVLVSHNIDLAPRVEGLRAGDPVSLRGQYEWNEQGGVIHWTHHDPDGRRPGGYLEHEGRTYR
jgi:hypothetical protein